MSLIQLTVRGISFSQTQNGTYALVLSEMEGNRTLSVIIGASEAQSITIALQDELKPPRPLTHDLFKSFSDTFSINIKKVIIYKLKEGVFYSSLMCEKDSIEEIIDARTSDAVAIAVRFEAPIYTSQQILKEAGVIIKSDVEKSDSLGYEIEIENPKEVEKSTEEKGGISKVSLKELHNQLNKAVSDENYEIAAKIRDEINNRS